MDTTKKMIVECLCGTVSDMACEGCGNAVCSRCSLVQIFPFDQGGIQLKHYCASCTTDVKKNVWGELYWKRLTSLFM